MPPQIGRPCRANLQADADKMLFRHAFFRVATCESAHSTLKGFELSLTKRAYVTKLKINITSKLRELGTGAKKGLSREILNALGKVERGKVG